MEEKTPEQKIKEAAHKVFVRSGFSGARMQEIADEAGLNKALVHYYYRSKEKLFEAIFEEAFFTLIPSVFHVFTGPEKIAEKISKFVHKYLEVILKHPYIPMFVLSEMHRSPDDFFIKFVSPELKGRLQNLLTIIHEAAERQEIRSIAPQHLFINMIGLCVFPFLARPMLQRMFAMNDETYQQILEERQTVITEFIINAIVPHQTA